MLGQGVVAGARPLLGRVGDMLSMPWHKGLLLPGGEAGRVGAGEEGHALRVFTGQEDIWTWSLSLIRLDTHIHVTGVGCVGRRQGGVGTRLRYTRRKEDMALLLQR